MATEANWYPDPAGGHQLRYWDGTAWTEHVSDNGVASQAPVQPPAPPVAVIPPAPPPPPLAPAPTEPALDAPATGASSKPWYKRPVPLIVVGAVVIGVIGAAASSLGGGSSGGSTTFPVSNFAAVELEAHSFFDKAGASLGSFDVVAGIPGCDADVALGLIQGADTNWPAAIKVPYEKVIADIQREQAACASQDQAAFIAANDDAAADLAAAGRAWDAMHCKVDDVFAESPTATCK